MEGDWFTFFFSGVSSWSTDLPVNYNHCHSHDDDDNDDDDDCEMIGVLGHGSAL